MTPPHQRDNLCQQFSTNEEADMAIWLNVFIEANEGMGNELAASYAKRCPDIRKEAGCNQFEFYQSIERPDFFILHEEWADEAALDAHRVLSQQQGVDNSHLRKGTHHREYVSIS
jgi:quinol monooxygenase YgiN